MTSRFRLPLNTVCNYIRCVDTFGILTVTLAERFIQKDEVILSFGGGHGLPGWLRALHYTDRLNFMHAIVAMYDNGGATGIMRLDSYGRKVALRDGISSIMAMVHPNDYSSRLYKSMVEMLTKKDDRGRVTGDFMVGSVFDQECGFSRFETFLKNCGLDLKGTVLPSSSHPSHIAYTTETDNRFVGEEKNDYNRMSNDQITEIRLVPVDPNSESTPGFPAAIEAIKKAKIIFLAPGTMHASLFSNFCPDGMKEAMQESDAFVVLGTNLVGMNVDGTNDATPIDLVRMVEKYTGVRPNGILIPCVSRSQFESENPKAAYLYWKREQARFMGWEADGDEIRDIEKDGVLVYTHNATSVVTVDENTEVVRHKPEELGRDIRVIFDSLLASK